jgi:hypothetical protein
MRKLLVRTALAAAAIATLGACASINERAWANGQAMSATREYQMKLGGDFGFDTQRALYNRSNPLTLSSPVRWTPARNYEK